MIHMGRKIDRARTDKIAGGKVFSLAKRESPLSNKQEINVIECHDKSARKDARASTRRFIPIIIMCTVEQFKTASYRMGGPRRT